MPTKYESTLILLAPCALLFGAVLQILVARLCSARTKGILAVITSLPAVYAVVATIRMGPGRTSD